MLKPILKLLDNRVVYIAAIILLVVLLFKGCSKQADLRSELTKTEQSIDNLKFKNKQLVLSDSTHALQVEAITYSSQKDIHNLRDSLAIALSDAGKLKNENGILKYKLSISPHNIPVISYDSVVRRVTDSLKYLPCDSLKKLADSNLLVVPAGFHLDSAYYSIHGRVTRQGVKFDPGYPKYYAYPEIVFGETRKWFLGKWKTSAVIGDRNPYATEQEGKYVEFKNKERKFGITVGYGVTYNIQQKTLTPGPTIVFGYRF